MKHRGSVNSRTIVGSAGGGHGLRLGLCCQFAREPISFRTTTAAAVARLKSHERLGRIAGICLDNAAALEQAVQYCAARGIGCFRVLSTICPLKTHPKVGYAFNQLPDADAIVTAFCRCGLMAESLGVRLTFHPDQFVVLNSPREDVVEKAIEDLEYHAEVAEWIGADVINIHGGGAYGDKTAALDRLARQIERLSLRVRERLTVENDDKVYTPSDLLPTCRVTGVPLVYDVHHHRCLPDGLSVSEATAAAIKTWDREPLFHLSSPIAGWSGPKPERHHNEIDLDDFPASWKDLCVTVEVEAKAKELAVLKLWDQLATGGERRTGQPSTMAHARPTQYKNSLMRSLPK